MLPESILKEMTTVCLHKREIRQPFTGERVLVPCGTCPACLMRRAYNNELNCKAMQSVTKYCYFVTLTYNTYTCPRYQFTSIKEDKVNNRILCTAKISPRPNLYRILKSKTGKEKRYLIKGLSYTDSFEKEFSFTPEYFHDYCKQASLNVDGQYSYLHDRFGYISRKDYALFMKRLRKYMFSKIGCYEKIHTYVVGEYSPKRFRPHFHILFFFDSDRFAENFGRALRSCWRYGRIDYSLSRKDATTYVAGYVNSASHVPWHLNSFREIKTFSRFSNGFKSLFFKDEIEDVKKGNFSSFLDGKDFLNYGKSWTIYPSQQVLDSCFFPYVSANISSVDLVRRAVFALSKLVTTIFNRKQGVTLNLIRLHNAYRYSRSWIKEPDWQFLFHSLRMDNVDLFLESDTFVSRFYNLMHRFQTTLRSYGLNLFDYKGLIHNEEIIDNILKLSNQYSVEYERKNQENHYRSNMVNKPYLGETFWAESENGLKEFLDSENGSQLLTYQSMQLASAVKHREQNDLNLKFVHPK